MAHLDTLGAMVREIKPNGPSAKAWCLLGCIVVLPRAPDGLYRYRPVAWHCLPLKTSGHAFGGEVDTQRRTGTRWKCAWTCARTAGELEAAKGIHVGLDRV